MATGDRRPDPQSPAWDDMALVGRIARPHGLRGEVVVIPDTDFVEDRFRPGAVLWTRTPAGAEQRLTIASARFHHGRPLVAFAGVGRVEEAELLAGLELRVPEASLRTLSPGQYYEHQLVGCTVETTTGDPVGSVARVEGTAGSSRLAVEGTHGEVLIPLAVDICVDIDVVARRIRIDPPEGLLDLNVTARSRRSG